MRIKTIQICVKSKNSNTKAYMVVQCGSGASENWPVRLQGANEATGGWEAGEQVSR